MIRSLCLNVTELKYYRGYSSGEGKPQAIARIAGIAHLDRGDAISVASVPSGRTGKIPFSARRVLDDSEHAWQLHIGFLPYDWEIGHDENYYFECYLPYQAFDDLEQAFLAGRVVAVNVRANTELWVHDHDWYTPPSDNLTWYLVPDEKPSPMPRGARGTIEDFGWQEAPVKKAAPVLPQPPEDTEAHKAGAVFAEDTIRIAMADAEAKPEPASSRKRFKWGVGVLIAALLVIAVMLAQR